MPQDNIFLDEWRKCLREHYKHTVQENDPRNVESLEAVLTHESVGFREDDLKALRMEATMHVDDAPEDFIPPEVKNVTQPHPAECTCAACAMDPLIEAGHDEDGQPLTEEALQELAEQQEAEAEDAPTSSQDDDSPQQLTMF